MKVAASTFDMGCWPGQPDCPNNHGVHAVTLTGDYWVGVTEVTQGEFEGAMGYNPSYFSDCGATCPVEQVSWAESVAYANALSSAAGRTECYTCTGSGSDVQCEGAGSPYDCGGYRLLTEAEWEGAARCGGDLAYSGSDFIFDVGWIDENSGAAPHATAGLAQNACGIHDMSGNVWEWTNDWYGSYGSDAVTDPTGPTTEPYGHEHVVRGGSWRRTAVEARVSYRAGGDAEEAEDHVGFRLARSEP